MFSLKSANSMTKNICHYSNRDGTHPAESSENTSICANIRKYVPINCLWWMFSQPHFEEGAIKIHVISIASICKFIISQHRLDG